MAVQNNKAEGTVLLEMKHVKKSFDKSGVLKDISLKVREGQVVSIIGPSGSGKSTLLNIMESLHCFAVQRFLKRWMQES